MAESSAELIRDLLAHAIPVSPPTPHTENFVTRDEFEGAIRHVEIKIENAALKQKLWVLSGVIAIMLTFGGGYVSLVSKLDRLNENMPPLVTKLEARGTWMQRQEQRDALQDGALRKIDDKYVPMPYVPLPQ